MGYFYSRKSDKLIIAIVKTTALEHVLHFQGGFICILINK